VAAPTLAAGIAARVALAAIALLAPAVRAVPLSPEELARLCAEADDAAHCGRLVEETQIKRLPNLATRDGATLGISLYPSGTRSFVDVEAPNGGRSYSLWDYLSEINAVVLFVTDGDDTSFTLLLRASGRVAELPADPKLSPDRARLVTADFCEKRCGNELAVWRVTRDGVRKESAWKPTAGWSDVVASWKDPDTVAIAYTAAGAEVRSKIERRLSDPSWTRVGAP
jgi:hypothetical protein